MKLENINYSEIIRESWKITWKHRFLWWFGLLVSLGGGMRLNFNFWNSENNSEKQGELAELWKKAVENYGEWILIGIIMAIAILITLWILRIIGQAGIIRALDQVKRNESTSFSSGFAQGKVYLWKILLTDMSVSIFMLLLILVFAIPIVFLFMNKSFAVGVLLTLLAILIFIPVAMLANYVLRYAYYYLVLSNLDIRSSLENGYLVFRRNIIPSLVMSLIFIPLSILLIIVVGAIFIFLLIIFGIIGFIAYLIFAELGLYIIIGIGIAVLLAAIIFLQSVFQAFSQTVWFNFFHQIATEKEPEKVVEETANVLNEKISEAGVYKAEEK